MKVRLTPAAERDVEAARDWYEEQQPGLGRQLGRELSRTLERIRSHPEMFREVDRRTRRALMRRFPYGVFFTRRRDMIEVFAVLHHARDPRTWRHRAARPGEEEP